MANSAQARKRVRQADISREANKAKRTKVRTWIKRVKNAIAQGDAATAEQHFKATQKVLDKAEQKGLFDANTVARYKSRLNKHIKALKSA